ncbi:hypothetical protein DES53_11525 [Roseimicrobium gellanilyticum]|uniref:Uncharacterized protein n=1 Tax=Roseimicrobium gellanilyticum TaxID=748857 RepID=A0A366H4E0_9BACT|nr:hypothetical protein [Roseimicrobium gellanilyticum]RBP36884.1 hypothetical protein DES53_11525 [Roseimicrobium gellanilyticum]
METQNFTRGAAFMLAMGIAVTLCWLTAPCLPGQSAPAKTSKDAAKPGKARTLEEDALHLCERDYSADVVWRYPGEMKVRLKDGSVVMRRPTLKCMRAPNSKSEDPAKPASWPVTTFSIHLQLREPVKEMYQKGANGGLLTTANEYRMDGWVRFGKLEESKGRRTLTFLREEILLDPNGQPIIAMGGVPICIGTLPGTGSPLEYKLEEDTLTLTTTAADLAKFFIVDSFPDLPDGKVELKLDLIFADMGW